MTIVDVVLRSWNQLDYQVRFNIWLWTGIALLSVILVIWYFWMRKLLGHRKFRGTWFNAREFQELINILKEDQDSGRRVMQYDEIQLLREWTLGTRKGLGLDRAKHGFW